MTQEDPKLAQARERTVFVCNSCGDESVRWEGRCPGCGEWNSLVETRRSARGPSPGPWTGNGETVPVELAKVAADAVPRLRLSSPEVNRVLGGGVVPGSLTLLAGDPGPEHTPLINSFVLIESGIFSRNKCMDDTWRDFI